MTPKPRLYFLSAAEDPARRTTPAFRSTAAPTPPCAQLPPATAIPTLKSPRGGTPAGLDLSARASEDARRAVNHLDGRLDLGLAGGDALDVAAQRNALLDREGVKLSEGR